MTVEGRRRNCRWYRGLGDSICFFSLLPIQIGIYNTYGWLLGWTRWLERFAYITCSWSGNWYLCNSDIHITWFPVPTK